MGCGYDRCMGALHFHHIDPDTKGFHIATGINYGWAEIEDEIKKTILLCANCHAEAESGMLDISKVKQHGWTV